MIPTSMSRWRSIEDDRQGKRARVLIRGADKKPASVRRYVVAAQVRRPRGAAIVEAEQPVRTIALCRWQRLSECHCHQISIQGGVKQFSTVGAPVWIVA